jgi:ABC-type transport system substrate-binding protein
MRKVKVLILLIPLIVGTFLLFLSVPIVSAQEEWEGVGIEWYYDNLTEEDRKYIRQAMDYSIPRDQVIEGLMKGFAVPLATEIGQNIMGYDPSIEPREFNVTKARQLMADVFGKTYDPDQVADDPDTYTDVPYFSMTLIAPTTNVARTQWAALTAKAFQDIGIDVELKWWNWNIIMPRIFLDPVGEGFNYEHGGHDGYFIGFSASADPDYSSQYYTDSFPPAGDNSMWVDRPDFVDIINRSLTDLDLNDRLQALKEYQAWFYEWVPKSIIRQEINIFAMDPNLEGFDVYQYGRYPWIHNITIPGQTVIYSTVPGDYVDFNPIVSNSWYDSVFTSNYHMCLSGRRGMYNLSHPIGHLAESWTTSSDGLEWTVNLREGVTFHDGSEVTADDVVFSYKAAYECPASTWSGDMGTWFNSSDDIAKIDKYTVKFTLKDFYPYVTTQVFGVPILSKAQMDPIPFEDWKTHGTNTGSEALLGCGPYKFEDYDGSATIKSVKYDGWDGTLMGHDPDAVGGGIWWNNVGPDVYYTTVVKEATTAVTNLKTGTVDLLDYNTGVHGQIDEIQAHPEWAQVITSLEYGWQELAYNHYDPRWGLNPQDPREMYPEDYEEAPFDTMAVILAIVSLGLLQVVRGKKKKKN